MAVNEIIDERDEHEKTVQACEGDRCVVQAPCVMGMCFDPNQCKALKACLGSMQPRG